MGLDLREEEGTASVLGYEKTFSNGYRTALILCRHQVPEENP